MQALCYTSAQIVVFSSFRVTQKIITLFFGEEFFLGNISLVNSKAFFLPFF